MSEVLWGVLMGGIIASITPIISLVYESKKWKKQTKIERLKEKRAKLETLFEKIGEKLAVAMGKNIYPSDMLSDIDFLVPKNVSDAFEKLMGEADKSDENMKFHYYTVMREMKKSLSEIDKDIDDEIN